MKSFQEKALDLVFIVKQSFINEPCKFDEFSRLITSPKLQRNPTRLITQLKTLFRNHPDLLLGLNHFLEDYHDDDDDDQPPKKKKKQCTGIHTWLLRDSTSQLFDKIRDRCIEKNDDEFRVLIHFSRTVLAYHQKKITLSQADFIFKNLFKDDPDLFIESNRVLAQSLPKPAHEKSDFLWKGTGIVECSLYEDTLDGKEFYLFEMDIAFSRLDSMIRKLDKDPEGLEECFTVLEVKCIKKLYSEDGDDGLGEEMVRIMQFDPVGRIVARMVVLDRLRQKKMQLEEQKLHLDKVWDEIFQDITEKGRVHRHRDFLQRTKKASTNGFGTNKQCRDNLGR